MVEVILSQNIQTKAEDETLVSANLRFVRAVGKAQIVEAFSDAFKNCDPLAISFFKDALSGAIPSENGLKINDEFRFNWTKNGVLFITTDGYTSPPITNLEISKRLLEVYLDSSKTVSKELLQNVIKNIEKL